MFKRVGLVATVVAAFFVLAVPAMAFNGFRDTFVLTGQCQGCHFEGGFAPPIYDEWVETAHANTHPDAVVRGAGCAGCHVGNYDPEKHVPTAPGVYPTAVEGTQGSGMSGFSEAFVGCSSCHYGVNTGTDPTANDLFGNDPANTAHLVPTQNMASAEICGQCHSRYSQTVAEYPAWTCPPVLVYTGHMVSTPDGRGNGAFPLALEATVRAEIRRRLERIRPVAAYGSAACGTDILCLEVTKELGGETHITLPFPPAEFRKVSVDPAPGWGERFDRVLAAADSVVVASDHPAEGSLSGFEYANLILTGTGRLRAQVLGTSLVGLAVWDGKPARGRGGTADVVGLWRARGLQVEHVDVAALVRSELGEGAAAHHPVAAAPPRPGATLSHEIKAMLFADAVGYSKLTENQIPIFIEHFLGAVGALNEVTTHRPIHMQTAGDGLYFVFDNTQQAGHYALELNRLMRTTDWTSLGLPPSFDLRIALHCGPIFCGRDPITKEPLYTGSHTSRTARIEPITPPGQVYTSSAFAAVAAATGVDDLGFSYVGRIPLAKHYGSLALYHVLEGHDQAVSEKR